MVIKSLRNIFLFASLLLIWESSSAYTVSDNENFTLNETKNEKPFEMNTYSITKPLLSKLKEEVKEIYETIENKDSEIKELNEIKAKYLQSEALIQELRSNNSKLKTANDLLKSDFEKLTNNRGVSNKKEFEQLPIENINKCLETINNLKSPIAELMSQSDNEGLNWHDVEQTLQKFATLNVDNKSEKEEDEPEVDKTDIKYLKFYSTCIPFVEDPGVHNITVSGNDSFQVLCDDYGWMKILSKKGNKQDFNRDWNTYREGFGSLNGDFFLGLEKLHQITKLQTYDLQIANSLGNILRTMYYDDFKIGSEDEGYKLNCLKLGKAPKNSWYDFSKNNNQKFTTYDRDNDDWKDGNCASKCLGGWWYKDCDYNKNLKMEHHETNFKCDDFWALKEVTMLIRPHVYN